MIATATATATAPVVDLAAVKRRQQEVWASGDYSAVGAKIAIVAELLCDAADLPAGSRVLDVATGSGNAALAAARCGWDAVGVDYVPALLERARLRADAELLDVELVEGDAEELPFPDGSFDGVLSVFGCMFAPDHARAAAELARVCRPGGTIALACWRPDGFVGEMFRVVAEHVPPPVRLPPPSAWGEERYLRALLGDEVSGFRARTRTCTLRSPSPERFVEFFRTWFGPMLTAYAALDAEGQAALTADLVALVSDWSRRDDAVAIPASYLEAVAVR